MATKDDLRGWVVDAIRAKGGAATIIEVAEYVWRCHEQDLRSSGRLFFTWQYDMRWCALELRKAKVLIPADKSPTGTWVAA
jgi:hypothetical protein